MMLYALSQTVSNEHCALKKYVLLFKLFYKQSNTSRLFLVMMQGIQNR